MTVDEFRRDPVLVGEAQKIINHPIFKAMMEACRESDVRNFQIPRFGVPESDKSMELGKIYGYSMFANNLESLGVPEVMPEKVEATFEAPEPTEEME